MVSIIVPRQQKLKNFGKKLRHLRTENNMTLMALAEALGYSAHGHISELEAGKKVPTVEFVIKVSDLFGVSTDELIRDEVALGNRDHKHESTKER